MQCLSICAAKEGIAYSFDNAQIIDYQYNLKYMGDVPFCVYSDFETTTGDSVFFYSKVRGELLSNFQFQSSIEFRQIVIYRSWQQTPQEIFL